MPETIGFIGLGNLGRPMAARLLDAGFALRVYNRSPEKAKPLAERGAVVVGAPAEVASRGGIVITVLTDDRAVEDVADEALLDALGPGGIHLSCSTLLPATSERLAGTHAGRGVAYLGCPVFGRPEAVVAGKLVVCVSGAAAAKARVRAVLEALGQSVFDFGEAPGAAHVVKLAGNFLLTAAIEGLAESAAFAEKNGVDRAALIGMLTQTLFNCPIYNNYGGRVIKADFDNVGFTAKLALKDMRLVLETAAASATPMPILGLLRDRLLALIANGRGELDSSALALGAARDAGLSWFEKK